MTNGRNHEPSPHLNETQLLAYLDGELPRADRESAHKHLESCWTCRGVLNEIQSSIEAFLNVRTEVLPAESAFAESRVEQFRQRLARHASETVGVPSWSERFAAWGEHVRAFASFALHPRQAAIAGVLVVTLLVVMFTDVLNTRVSADTLLARADQYQTVHAPAKGHVSRMSLRVERIERRNRETKSLGTITVVHDSATPQMYVDAQSASGESEHAVISASTAANGDLLHTMLSSDDSLLEQYLDSEHWVPDLSADAFRRLVAGQKVVHSSARRLGDAFEVSYQLEGEQTHGIAQALLQVAATDYAPASMSVITGDQETGREYRFTRTSFSQDDPRTPELAALFVPPAALTETTARSRELPPLSKPVPIAYEHSRASDREVEVAEALHKADACLGEEIYIFPMSDGSLLVQGLVDSASRRTAILQTLKPVGDGLRVEIYLPREIKSGSDLYNPPVRFTEKSPVDPGPSLNGALADTSTERSPLYQRLNQHFSEPGVSSEDTEKEVAVFSNEVVTMARQTFLHAWALKRLDGEFSNARISNLSPATLQKIDQMRQDHRRWIATLAKRESAMISPIAGSSVASQAASQAAGELDTDALLRLAEQQSELIQLLFGSARPAQETDASLAQLLAVVRRMGS